MSRKTRAQKKSLFHFHLRQHLQQLLQLPSDSRLLAGDGKMDQQELRFLLTGPLGDADCLENPNPKWISGVMWNEVCTLDKLPAFNGLVDSFYKENDAFYKVYDLSLIHI